MAENTTRFLRQPDILPPGKLQFPIVVIGAGAIGSAAVVTLTKTGCSNITVWDPDTLEEHNASNQLCRLDAIGKPKVDALAQLTTDLTGVSLKSVCAAYRGQRLQGVVIVAVDSMTARQEVWKRVKLDHAVPLLIDARMGAAFARVYAVHPTNMDDVDFYEQNLYAAEETERLPCSARAIIYWPTVIGGLIALLAKAHATGVVPAREILFDLPSLKLMTVSAARQAALVA
jgi:hypothetical protein